MQRTQLQTENAMDIFIKGWGRMGVSWGVGKVMAEIQALLFMSRRPLGLDEMAARLRTSRSNISLNVRALQDLGVVKKVIIPGDRKDYYTAEADVAKVARHLAVVKKKREIDPALDVITKVIDAANGAGENNEPTGAADTIDTDRLLRLKRLVEEIGEIMDTFIGPDPEISPGSRGT